MNKSWKVVELGDICSAKSGNSKIIKGRLATENNGFLFPAFSATGQDIYYDAYEHEGDAIIISAVGARCGKCFLAHGQWTAIANTHIIFPNTELVTIGFLWYLLNDENFWFKGGTAQPFVKVNASLKKKIKLPPLPEQERIVRLLDEAESLRVTRERANVRMEHFIPALFQEMFGDVIENEKSWNIAPITDLSIKFSDGPFGSNLKTSHYTESGIRVVRLQNIGVGDFVDDNKASISELHFKSLIKHECVSGDVLVGTMGNPNLRACILPNYIPVALNKADCVQIRPNPKTATAEYICWLLNMPSTLKMASGLIQGQTRARISMGRLRELHVPLPPLALQREFAARVEEARGVQSAQGKSAGRVEALYQSMLSRAFAGEL